MCGVILSKGKRQWKGLVTKTCPVFLIQIITIIKQSGLVGLASQLAVNRCRSALPPSVSKCILDTPVWELVIAVLCVPNPYRIGLCPTAEVVRLLTERAVRFYLTRRAVEAITWAPDIREVESFNLHPTYRHKNSARRGILQ